jgi:putative ABC transport system ATP-binding protein
MNSPLSRLAPQHSGPADDAVVEFEVLYRANVAAVTAYFARRSAEPMSLLGALEQPTSGVIEVDGQDITRLSPRELVYYRARKIGFVFQSYNLVPNLTATENVMLPMEFIGVGKGERRKRARGLLDLVELTGARQERKPSRLSGGEQQRVAIARALANQPSIILADEPAGNLDTQTSETTVELLRDLSRSEGTTVVLVTHDASIADQADRLLRLDDGQLALTT